jgi:cell division protein CrgA
MPKESGRVTPKGTTKATTKGTGRYTPPVPKAVKVSPVWVPVLMGSLLGVGAILIICNYLNVLPGGASNAYLLVGLALITAGFITATQWH